MSALNFKDRSRPSFIEVSEQESGQRIDNYLFKRFKDLPKTLIYRIIRKGELRINKGRVKQTTRIEAGDLIRLPPLQTGSTVPLKQGVGPAPIATQDILFEDDVLMVLNKPSGLAVHAGSGIKHGLIESLRASRTDLRYLELVHRLDRPTSGCLVLAKRASALRALHSDFQSGSLRSGRLKKVYLCMVEGHWRGGERRVERALNTQSRRGGERHVSVHGDGQYACSIFRPLSKSAKASLMEVQILTGRTHQVRVHAVAEGHAIAGDDRYGAEEFNSLAKKLGLSRLFLHAHEISFVHPVTETRMSFIAPLPQNLYTVLDKVGLDIPSILQQSIAQ
ncbi:MAG: RluA family pseudouridine synthase [Pseudomonadota bacterium]